jgi:hypothetical protein
MEISKKHQSLKILEKLWFAKNPQINLNPALTDKYIWNAKKKLISKFISYFSRFSSILESNLCKWVLIEKSIFCRVGQNQSISNSCGIAMDKKYMKILQISVCKSECVSELFRLYRNFSRNLKKLTNTFKCVRSKMSKIQVKLHGRVLYTTWVIFINFYLWYHCTFWRAHYKNLSFKFET